MSVFKMVSPELGFGFRWEPESRNLYVIRLSNDKDYEQIATGIMSPEAAQTLAAMWCRGYKSAQREAARDPAKRHFHMYAEPGRIGANPSNIMPVILGDSKVKE